MEDHRKPLLVQKICDPASLETLRGEWARLWQESPSATPFQAPEWLLNWWAHLGGGSLWVLTFRHEGRLVGLAPLFIHQWPDGISRRVSWMGSGISDHLDLLTDPLCATSVAQSFFHYLRENQADWDMADLQDTGTESPLINFRADGLHARFFSSAVCPVLTLPGSLREFRDGLRRIHRRSIVQAGRKLLAVGELRVAVASAEDFASALEDLFRLHAACWGRKNLPGMLGDPAVQRFHRCAGPAFLRIGGLRLYGLRLNGRTVASLYVLVKGARLYGYLGGFDPEMEKFSPGTFLLNHILENSLLEGIREFDFLRGPEKYKYAWGARDRTQHRLVLWHSEDGVRTDETGAVFFAGGKNG